MVRHRDEGHAWKHYHFHPRDPADGEGGLLGAAGKRVRLQTGRGGDRGTRAPPQRPPPPHHCPGHAAL